MHRLLLLTLLACGGTKGATPPTDPSAAAQPALVGQPVADAAPLPDFAAISHDGTPRSRDDLLGHPTVVWFFPVAGTPG